LSRLALSAEISFFPTAARVAASPSSAAGSTLLVAGQPLKVTKVSNSKSKAGRLARLKRSWRERFARRAPVVKPQVPVLPPPPPPLAFDIPSIVREAWQDRIEAQAYIPGVTPRPAMVSVSSSAATAEPASRLIPRPTYWSVEYVAASALAQTQAARYRGDSSPQARDRFRL